MFIKKSGYLFQIYFSFPCRKSSIFFHTQQTPAISFSMALKYVKGLIANLNLSSSLVAELAMISINPATQPPTRQVLRSLNSAPYKKQKLLSSMSRFQNQF